MDLESLPLIKDQPNITEVEIVDKAEIVWKRGHPCFGNRTIAYIMGIDNVTGRLSLTDHATERGGKLYGVYTSQGKDTFPLGFIAEYRSLGLEK